MFPLKHRSQCVGLTTMADWIGVYFVAQLSPFLFDSVNFGAFFVFATFSLVAFAISWWLPETKGVPLEDIDRLFDVKLGPRLCPQRPGVAAKVDAEASVPSSSAPELEVVI